MDGMGLEGTIFQEISNRTHGFRTPNKPEYLIALSRNLLRGPLGFGPTQFLMDVYIHTYIYIDGMNIV